MSSTLRNRAAAPIEVLSGKNAIAEDEPLLDVPAFTPPSFSVKDLLDAIPKHCWERSALKSSFYLVVELLVIAGLFVAASSIDGAFGPHGSLLAGTPGSVAKWAAWAGYWWWQGLFMTGAHECGHQAFSSSKSLNNGLGLVLHSLLLVPYHSWRISHARHHAGTGHTDRDEVFVPRTRAERGAKAKGQGIKKTIGLQEVEEVLEDVPIYRLASVIVQQLLGWPLHLTINASGQHRYPAWTNHFNPNAIFFDKRHRNQVIVSDIGLLVTCAILHYVRLQVGWAGLIKYYGIPYICVNHWLVMITYLQHTDPIIPHYRPSQWTFPRGALSTMDRNLLGPIGPYILHGICETHVSHHIASKIPHYNAWEATEALKQLLGPHYLHTDENMFVSLWESARRCRFVDEDEEIVFYKDAYGNVARRVELAEKLVDSGVDFQEEEIE
ncbi:hypothetical protein RQP46_005980 [Phenoliferia psychrophenolica]